MSDISWGSAAATTGQGAILIPEGGSAGQSRLESAPRRRPSPAQCWCDRLIDEGILFLYGAMHVDLMLTRPPER